MATKEQWNDDIEKIIDLITEFSFSFKLSGVEMDFITDFYSDIFEKFREEAGWDSLQEYIKDQEED